MLAHLHENAGLSLEVDKKFKVKVLSIQNINSLPYKTVNKEVTHESLRTTHGIKLLIQNRLMQMNEVIS